MFFKGSWAEGPSSSSHHSQQGADGHIFLVSGLFVNKWSSLALVDSNSIPSMPRVHHFFFKLSHEPKSLTIEPQPPNSKKSQNLN